MVASILQIKELRLRELLCSKYVEGQELQCRKSSSKAFLLTRVPDLAFFSHSFFLSWQKWFLDILLLLTDIVKINFCFWVGFFFCFGCFFGFLFVGGVVEFAGWRLVMHLLFLDLVHVHMQTKSMWKVPKALFAQCALMSIINKIQQLEAVGNFIWMLSKLLNSIKLNSLKLPNCQYIYFLVCLVKGWELWC